MNVSQITIAFVLASLASVFVIVVFPHPRRAIWFEAVLWLGTLLVALLGAILGIAAASQFAILQGPISFEFLDTPLLPAVLGALGAALVLNVPLTVMGRLENTASEAAELNESAAAANDIDQNVA